MGNKLRRGREGNARLVEGRKCNAFGSTDWCVSVRSCSYLLIASVTNQSRSRSGQPSENEDEKHMLAIWQLTETGQRDEIHPCQQRRGGGVHPCQQRRRGQAVVSTPTFMSVGVLLSFDLEPFV